MHAGVAKDSTYNSVTTPIYPSSTFAFEGPGRTKGYDYSRTANPTRTALEECLAALEGGTRASATATGMAAETTVMHLFEVGSIIAGHDIYGGTYRLFSDVLPDRGLTFSFVNMGQPSSTISAFTKPRECTVRPLGSTRRLRGRPLHGGSWKLWDIPGRLSTTSAGS